METFCDRPRGDREAAFLRASDSLGLSAAAIEKDFWVCFSLRVVTALECGPHLAFKGGTSLSKGYGLIERFSEDIDLVIDREFLGFGGDNAPEAAGSNTQRRRRVEDLQAASRLYIGNTLLPDLRSALGPHVNTGLVREVGLDPDEADEQAILIEYASVTAGSGYLRPAVKLELGARSAVEPSTDRTITPYLARFTGHGLSDHKIAVRVVAPERTFLDKVALLHEESFRPGGPRARLARHYYDVHCMLQKGIAESALEWPGLFDDVVEHRRTYFRGSAEAQASLERGRIRLIPAADRLPAWRSDYEAMRDTMFFGPAPPLEQILGDLQELERRINRLPE